MARVFKTPVTVEGDVSTSGVIKVTQASGAEGGQIELATAPSGTLAGTNVTIDVYNNRLRFFESGGTNRGYYIDLSSGGASVGTSLTSGSSGVIAVNYPLINSGTSTSANLRYDEASQFPQIFLLMGA